MKKVLLVGVILLIVVIGVGCGGGQGVKTITDEDGVTWGVMKSPITGKYYEVAQRNGFFASKAGMVEISQSEYDEFIEEKK